jgi:hypothetical protein
MSNITALPVPQADAAEIMERVLLLGDLSKLNAQERTSFYMQTCQSLGLNPLTRPFDYIRLSGREVLYAKRDAADQLRKINRISLEIVDRKISGDLLVVTVRATAPEGRTDEDMGVVPVKGLAGEALSNAMLKAMTKAKRRVTLSICGLGMLDETEVRSAVEAEALAGPVAENPKAKAISAPAPKVEKQKIKIKLHDGGTAEFDRTGAGLMEAYEFLSAGCIDGHPEVVGLNNLFLDWVVGRYPAMADDIAELRAAAAMAMMPKDDEDAPDGPFDGDEDRDAFGLPPERGEALPTDPP